MKCAGLAGLLSVFVLPLAGCGTSTVNGEGGDTACPAELILHGRTYRGTDDALQLPRAERAGSARFTSCDDGHGGEDPNAEVPAWKLPDTSIDEAFAAELGGVLYLYISEDVEDPCHIRVADC